MLAPAEPGPGTANSAGDPERPSSVTSAPISVAILCGGASRRMGADKALLSLRPGAPPMLALVIDRVRALTDDLFLVGVRRPAYDRFGVPLVEDRHPGAGPLGGIATALAAARHSHCLIVACDMPFLKSDLLAWMAALPRDQYDVLVPVLADVAADGTFGSIPQPLHAMYSRDCLPSIQRHLQAGERRATCFYTDVRVTKFASDQVGDDELYWRSFFSADTPEALVQARAWLPD